MGRQAPGRAAAALREAAAAGASAGAGLVRPASTLMRVPCSCVRSNVLLSVMSASIMLLHMPCILGVVGARGPKRSKACCQCLENSMQVRAGEEDMVAMAVEVTILTTMPQAVPLHQGSRRL